MPPAPSSIQCWVESIPSPQRTTTTRRTPSRQCATTSQRRARVVLGEVAANGAGRGHITKQKRFMDTTHAPGRRSRGMGVKGREGDERVRGGHGQGQRRVSPRRLQTEDAVVHGETETYGRPLEKDRLPGMQQQGTGDDSQEHEHEHEHEHEPEPEPEQDHEHYQDETANVTPRASRWRRPPPGQQQRLNIRPLPSDWAESLASTSTSESGESFPTRSRPSRTTRSIASTGSSSAAIQSPRSKSPSKTAADLLPAGISIGQIKVVPADIAHLYTQLSDLRDGIAVVPWLMYEEVARLCAPRTIHKHMLQERGASSVDNNDACISQKQQLHELLHLQHEAEQCQTDDASESAWNVKVHGPLLRLALAMGQSSSLCFEVVTHATICPPFLPISRSTGQLQSARIVDFTLNLNLHPDDDTDVDMHRAILAHVSSQPLETRTINHTLYSPLRFKPCTTAIETKTSNSTDDGRVQLALWASAHFIRLRSLATPHNPTYRPITLPLVRTVGHYWYFLYAVETCQQQQEQGQERDHPQQQRFEILSEVEIGNTKDVVGLYTLLWALGALAKWSDDMFRPWFRAMVLAL